MFKKTTALVALLLLCALPALAEEADEAGLILRREASDLWAQPGGWVTLVYTVRNTAGDEASDIAISDPLLGAVAQIDLLAPGESKTVTSRVRVSDACLSAPSMRYTLRGETREAEIEPLQIGVEEPRLSLAAVREDGALAIDVTNEGNAPLCNVCLSEPRLGDYGCAAAYLKAGESARVTWPALRGNGALTLEASAVTPAGTRVTARADLDAADEAIQGAEAGAEPFEDAEPQAIQAERASAPNPFDDLPNGVSYAAPDSDTTYRLMVAAVLTLTAGIIALWTAVRRREKSRERRRALSAVGGAVMTKKDE